MDTATLLKARGLVNQFTAEKLETIVNEPRTVYLGVDPSSDSMTVGNLVALMALRNLRDAGHTVIFLAGGGTGMIGDPKPDSERQLLPRETIVANVAKLKEQAERILNIKDLKVVDNYDWLGKLGLIEFLRDVGKYFTVNSLVKKDAIASRMESEEGITYTEFSYPLLQGYDYLHLYREHGCTLQIGGSDQWGNIVSGVDLIRRKHEHTAHALTFPLVIDKATGKKFGKSEGNAVWLDASKTPPFAFYQFWFNQSDESVADFLKIYTLLPLTEIETILTEHAADKSKRIAQRALAYEVTKIVHGAAQADNATTAQEVLFGESQLSQVKGDGVAWLTENAPHATVSVGASLVDVLIESGLATSKREAREFIEGGAVTLAGVKVTDPAYTIAENDFEQNGLQLLKRGKQKVVILVRKDV
jgi:tyrosyl-tRNA synthetase